MEICSKSISCNLIYHNQENIIQFGEKIKTKKAGKFSDDFIFLQSAKAWFTTKRLTDALDRSMAYFSAGADGIIIDSKEDNSNEVFKLSEKFWKMNQRLCHQELLIWFLQLVKVKEL